eukprot:5641889-Pyramimonas_sp.AAC.1
MVIDFSALMRCLPCATAGAPSTQLGRTAAPRTRALKGPQGTASGSTRSPAPCFLLSAASVW